MHVFIPPPSLSFSDVNTSVPDKKCIMMYVMCLFQSLPPEQTPLTEIDLTTDDAHNLTPEAIPQLLSPFEVTYQIQF